MYMESRPQIYPSKGKANIRFYSIVYVDILKQVPSMFCLPSLKDNAPKSIGDTIHKSC